MPSSSPGTITLSSPPLPPFLPLMTSTSTVPISLPKKPSPFSSSPIIASPDYSILLQMNPVQSDEQSFYSIDGSKSEFTFVEEERKEAREERAMVGMTLKDILEKFDIRQSSAIQLESQDILNRSFGSIAQSNKQINLHDISAIDQPSNNELECSVCLQNEIDCLSLPAQSDPRELLLLQEKITKLKSEQSLLQRQIAAFHQLLTDPSLSQQVGQLMQSNKFSKKKCEHDAENAQPFNIPRGVQISIKELQASPSPSPSTIPQQKKHFDIKPNRNRTPSQKETNAKYKECSFNRRVMLVQDLENEYRVEVGYEQDSLWIALTNFQKGDTNFLHALRVNEQNFLDKISERIVYPLSYTAKKFTVSLSIMLLIFEQNKPKDQSSLIKIEEIRSLSLPLPLNYLIEPRFLTTPADHLEKLRKRLYLYEIDINHSGDYSAYLRLKQEKWISHGWVSLKGRNNVVMVELGEMKEKQDTFTVIFRIGCKEKDCQEAIDLIQYLCFMLAL